MAQSRGLAAGLLVAALSASCSLAGFELTPVDVGIPTVPPPWIGLDGIELVLVWRDSTGTLRRKSASPGAILTIELPKGLRRALIVEAWFRNRPLRPAGALWPDDLAFTPDSTGAPMLEIRWFEGWTASVLLALAESGADRGIDFLRLDSEARARLLDPWLIDPNRVALAIRERTFRSDTLSTGAARSLTLPPGGPWFAESPFAEAPTPRDGAWETRVVSGLHRWYSKGLELFVAMPEEGEPVMLVRAIE